MSFPRYPAYKDSGVDWLGEVPEHWVPKKITAISSLKGRLGWQGLKADEYRDHGPYVVSSAHFDNFQIDWDACPRVSQERYDIDSNIQLAPNDVLLMKDGAAMGKLAFVESLPGPACLNSHLLLFRPVNAGGEETYFPRFAFYYMQTGYFQEYIKVNGTGATFLGISQDAIGHYQIAMPPRSEQIAIASFLERETAKIDALVVDYRAMIELLQEKRQGVISHAVTKGLDPTVPMKDSGVEWLGEVPEHWVVLTMQRCVAVAEGQVDPRESPYSDMLLIAPNHVESGTGKILEFETAAEQGADSGKYLCDAGSVVYSKIRPALRKVCIAPQACLCSADMYPLQGRRGLSNFFLLWVILSEQFSSLAVLESDRVAMPKINRESLKAVRIPMPPMCEQDNISSFLADETAGIDSLVTDAQDAISLLQERRTALISAAVTGKINVHTLVQQTEEAA